MSRSSEYARIDVVGKGAFATVWKALHKKTNTTVAFKAIPKDTIRDTKMKNQLVREVEAMKRINHPHIIRFYDFFETDTEFCIVCEYVSGPTLLEKVNEDGPFPEHEVRRLFSQLVSAVDYLHTSAKVVHRDLKCENVIIDPRGNVRIIDFGLSNVLETDDSLFETKCGSPGYIAPEIVNGKMYSKSADIWALGVILYVMAMGEMPFSSDNLQILLRKITLEQPTWGRGVSAGLVNMNMGLLEKKPMERMTIDSIKSHGWFLAKDYIEWNICGLYKELDPSIIDKIEKMGIVVTTLRNDLHSGACTDATAAYRILYAKVHAMDGGASKIGSELQKKAVTFTPMSRPKLKMLLPFTSPQSPRSEQRIRVVTRRGHPMAHRVNQFQ